MIFRAVVFLTLSACCVCCVVQREDPDTAPKRDDEYRTDDFESRLASANESLAALNRQLAVAHNDICSAQIGLKAYEQAIVSCREALDLAPDLEPARQNLTRAYERLLEQKPSVRDYIELSLLHYQGGEMDKSIIAAQNALLIESTSAIAYNNICSAYAQKKQWESAIRACERALEIAPGYELAQANLDWCRNAQAAARRQSR